MAQPTVQQIKLSRIEPVSDILRRELDYFESLLHEAKIGSDAQFAALLAAKNTLFELGREAGTKIYFVD